MYIFGGAFFQLGRILNDILFRYFVLFMFTLNKSNNNSQKNEEISPDLFHLCEPELYIYSDPSFGLTAFMNFKRLKETTY